MKIDWAGLGELPMDETKMSRHLAVGSKMSCMRVVADQPGRPDLTPHWHHNEQWVVVVSGAVNFVEDGTEYELRAGDAAFIPAGVRHTITQIGEEGAVLYELSAPGRLDLMPGTLVPSALRFD
ncbi:MULTISPECIES: cupin domain-containing protein [unclassified Streptomyces]|uniref:cupin domain-containing protein n=1 Tax=unclassified Streptomyces TaxID=2593676 RepID=UPI00278C3116|nr:MULTISPECIES: cupin domain-containing protein [unclassified Streptomyces]